MSKNSDIQKVLNSYIHEAGRHYGTRYARKPSLDDYDRFTPLRQEYSDQRRSFEWRFKCQSGPSDREEVNDPLQGGREKGRKGLASTK